MEISLGRLLSYGHYSVDLFIVLSGYCLALPIVRGTGALPGGALDFFRRRAIRIIPPYFFAMGLSLGLIWLCIGKPTGSGYWDSTLPITPFGILTHLLLIQDVFPSTYSKINYAFWSISVEWRIYFLFPLLVWARSRFGVVTMAIACIAASLVLFFALTLFLHDNLTSEYVGLFALGILAADVAFSPTAWAEQSRRRRWGMWTVILSVIVQLLTFVPVWHGRPFPLKLADYIVGAWAFALLVWATDRTSLLHRCLTLRWLAFIGTFAYSIYLIHAPLLAVLWQYVLEPIHLPPRTAYLALNFLGIPAIVLASYIFFLLFEQPFIRRRNPKPMVPAQ
jgi:peptidoglycan/LPS O-acetylase OafA/YrhL